MRQKTQLACALIRPAAVLVLDEPVVGLDPPSQALLHGLLNERKRAGKAVLLTTHQMAFADGLADRAVLLEEGVVADEGPWEEVRDEPRRADGRRTSAAAVRRAARRRARMVAERHPPPSLGQRLDIAYTVAIVGAIFGALAYGTASSALAQVVTPEWLGRTAPRSRCSRCCSPRIGAPIRARWCSRSPTSRSCSVRRCRGGLAVRRLALVLAVGAAAGAVAAAVLIVGLAGEGRASRG